MEFIGVVGAVMLVLGIVIGRFVLSGRTGSGGATITIDGKTVAFTRNELFAIFAQFTEGESQASALTRYYSDRNQPVPEQARVAAEAAFIDAARRWLEAHPEVARRKGFGVS